VVRLSDREALTMSRPWLTGAVAAPGGGFEEWITAVIFYRDHLMTCLCRHRGEEKINHNPFGISALEVGEWSMTSFGRSYSRERPGNHRTGGWVGPRVGLGGQEKSRTLVFELLTAQAVAGRCTN
jgi:hypothetical protein